MNIQKTKPRKGIFLDFGEVWFNQKFKYCTQCERVFNSEELSALVPEYANFGFDIIEFIGREIFVKKQTEREIVELLLKERNVEISPSEVTYLGKKFILYLAQAHKEKEPEIKHLIHLGGGFFLHLDSTCDGDSPHLFCAIEEMLRLVLVARKIPSESCESVVLILEELKRAYGTPAGIICDMGKGILAAIKEIFPEVRVFICHFHWLRDIGKDLLKEDDSFLGSVLRDFEVKTSLSKFSREFRKLIKEPALAAHLTASVEDFFKQKLPDEVLAHLLVEWIQSYTDDLDGYGFPFDRANVSLVDRMIQVHEHLKGHNVQEGGHLQKILELLNGVLCCRDLQECLRDLKKRILYFERLRVIMKIAPPDGEDGLNDDGEDADMSVMEKELNDFTAREDIKKAAETDRCVRKMLAQIEKYKDRLFTDGVEVIDAKGNKVLIHCERTNNIAERAFRDEKRGHRKRTGNKSMSQILKTMLAETPYVKNLANAEYLKIILNGNKTLAERFAEIDSKTVREAMKEHNEKIEKLDPRVKKVIRMNGLLQNIADAISNVGGSGESKKVA